MTRRRALTLALVTLLLAVACAPPAPPSPPPLPTSPPGPRTLRLGYSPQRPADWPLWVGTREGQFAAEGIQLELVPLASTDQGVQSVREGTLELLALSADRAIVAVERDGDLVLIGGLANRVVASVVGGATLTAITQIRDQPVAAPPPTDAATVLLQEFLETKGVGPGEYRLLTVEGPAARLDALRTGATVLTVLPPPYDEIAAQEGYWGMGRVAEVAPDYQDSALVAGRRWARANQDALWRLFRGLRAALAWLYDPANRDAAAALYAAEMQTDEAAGLDAYQAYVQQAQALSRTGELSSAGVDRVLATLAKRGELPRPAPAASKYVDDSYYRAAEQRAPTR